MSHDEHYKLIFSCKEIIIDLIKNFTIDGLADQLDLETLETVNSQYKKRKGDIVWKVKFKDSEQSIYLLILLEFQSTIDFTMPTRILTYTGELYQKLIEKQGLNLQNEFLPAVLPIVIYNGIYQWKAQTEIQKLHNPYLPESLKNYQPHQGYFLIDLSQFRQKEISTILNNLFAIESNSVENETDLNNLIDEFNRVVAESNFNHTLEDILRKFLNYACEHSQKRRAKSMALKDNLEKIYQQKFHEGFLEGEQRGKLESKKEIAKSLLGLLDDQTIALKTGLSLEEIQQLKH